MTLTAEELDVAQKLVDQLKRVETFNAKIEAYYEGSQRVRKLGIAIPPAFSRVETVVGWPGMAVDSLEERLDWLGWAGGDDFGLGDVFVDNELDTEAGMAHLDALIFGISFATLSKVDGRVRVRAQSPRNATGLFAEDGRTLRAGLITTPIEGRTDAAEVELLLPDQIIYAERSGTRWEVLDRQPHGLGQAPMVALPNRRRTSRLSGRSEITRAIRSITDDGVRTMLGMGINREFYSSPQRYALGADEKEFVNEDGSPKPGWQIVMGSVWAIGKDEDGDKPEVGEFKPASPAPYVDQVKMLSQLMAGESACPAHYFGFVTENPASADAIRSAEARLVKRAERRQTAFGQGWMRVGRLAARMLDGAPDDFNARVSCRWRDASTPTKAATADAVLKLVQGGVLPARSGVVLDMLGLSQEQQTRIQADWLTAGPTGLAGLAAAVGRQTN